MNTYARTHKTHIPNLPHEEIPAAPVSHVATSVPSVRKEPSRRTAVKDTGVKALAVVGLVVVLSALAWGGVRVVQYLPQAASSLAAVVTSVQSVFIPNESIMLSSSTEDPLAGDTFDVSWEHTGKEEDGAYTFSYECREGLHFELRRPSGENEIVFCNTAMNILDTETDITLTPVSTKERFVEVPVEVQFTENDSRRVNERGALALTVVNPDIAPTADETSETPSVETASTTDSTTEIEEENTPDTPTAPVRPPLQPSQQIERIGGPSTPGAPVIDPNGKADLKITILQTGVIDPRTNVFTPQQTVTKNDRVGIKFLVENVGTNVSGPWAFESTLPTLPVHTFESKPQQSLAPGDRIDFTFGFDKPRGSGINVVTIDIDPDNKISSETNRSNNTAQVGIAIKR